MTSVIPLLGCIRAGWMPLLRSGFRHRKADKRDPKNDQLPQSRNEESVPTRISGKWLGCCIAPLNRDTIRVEK